MKGMLLPRKMWGLRLGSRNNMLSVQVSGCSECQSLAFAVLGEGGNTCVRCDQVNDLLNLVVDLKEEVERLRSIKECEREIDW